MDKKIYFLYTGQGSQYFGMCRKYYDEDAVFRHWMDWLNHIAINETGHSVIRYLFKVHDIRENCDDITMTHLAIVMVEYAMTKSLIEKGIKPDVLVGSSLGEYVCMAVSGMIEIKELMRLLADQSYLLKRKSPLGKMAAVIAEYQPGLYPLEGVEIAAVDYSRHFVISGTIENVERTSEGLKKRGIDVVDIPVRYGFHSDSIECIREDFGKLTDRYAQLPKGSIPVISCFKGELTYTYSQDELWGIVRRKIRFEEVIRKYCWNTHSSILIDVGPSGTLAGFSKNILNRKSGIYGIINPFHNEKRNIEKISEEVLV